jgi:hypothetical protein
MGDIKKEDIMFDKQRHWIFFAGVLWLGLAGCSVLAHEREYWVAADEVDWDYAPHFLLI